MAVYPLEVLLLGFHRLSSVGDLELARRVVLEGVAAETAGAITLFMTEHFKIPVSTTHTITGAIIGVGLSKRVSAVRWGITISLMWAWILTIPVSAVLAASLYYILSVFL